MNNFNNAIKIILEKIIPTTKIRLLKYLEDYGTISSDDILNNDLFKTDSEIQVAAVKSDIVNLKHILDNGIKLSEDTQLQMLSSNYKCIAYFLHYKIKCTPKVLLKAADMSGYAVQYMLQYKAKITDGVLTNALVRSPELYSELQKHINIPESVIINALKRNNMLLQYLKDAKTVITPNMKHAVSYSGGDEEIDVDDVTVDDIKIMLKAPIPDFDTIITKYKSILNDDIIISILKTGMMNWIHKLIENVTLSERVKLFIANTSPSKLEFLIKKNIPLSDDVQFAAVKKWGKFITTLFNNKIIPSDRVVLAALKDDITIQKTFKYYKYRPTKAVKDFIKKNQEG